jgi:phosphatidylinositol alpha-1,6-mannosyltransferase
MALKKILFLNLTAFSATGGIEKFNRAFLKALSDVQKEGHIMAEACSAYDDKADSRYFADNNYKGFNGKKISFAFHVFLNAHKFDTIVLSHIHLSSIVMIVKALSPSKQIILIAHGIEVWKKLSSVQQKVLQQANIILAVSAFTKQKLVEVHGINQGKITVFHNTIDPCFSWPGEFKKPQYLLERYNLKQQAPVIFTLTRLSYSEKYKGYDKVMQIIPFLKKRFPDVKYILSGQPDTREEKRLVDLKETNNIKDEVLLTGFVKEEEVTDHYLLADVFILPSRKEGFGIVFIEAMACGVPVIGGNQDGTADALQQGELGCLVDPDDEIGMLEVLENILSVKDKIAGNSIKKELQQKVMKSFGFEIFKQNLKKVLA